MPERRKPTRSTPSPFTEGWSWLLLTTAAQAYLVFLLTLVAIATIPLALGWHGSVVQGGSMEPKISIGDVVLSTDLPRHSPVVIGGVVQFDRASPDGSESMSVLHRVVGVNDDGTYITAGDANGEVDTSPLTREKITGQARILIQYVGLPGYWFKTANFLPLMVWVSLTILAIAVSTFAITPRRFDSLDASENSEAEPANSVVGRRTYVTLVVGSVGVGLLILPRAATSAAFTGMTTNARNKWSVRVVAPITLGRATPYTLFAATKIRNEGSYFTTFITGSAGTSPGTAIERFAFWQISGSQDADNQVARDARTDLTALYKSIDSRIPTATLNSTLSSTIVPGTYTSKNGKFTVSNTLTLDARGDSTAIFIFRARDITAARNSYIRLTNKASANNVFWRATSDIVLERNSVASGNFLADKAAAMQSGADLTGRLISLIDGVYVTSNNARLPE